MKTIVPNYSFTGYPNGKRARFEAGQEYEVADALAGKWEANGSARIKAELKPEPKAKPATKSDD